MVTVETQQWTLNGGGGRIGEPDGHRRLQLQLLMIDCIERRRGDPVVAVAKTDVQARASDRLNVPETGNAGPDLQLRTGRRKTQL